MIFKKPIKHLSENVVELVLSGHLVFCFRQLFKINRETDTTLFSIIAKIVMMKLYLGNGILANRPALRGTRTHFDRCTAVHPH